ncbi:MAG TPA: glycine cleavage system aminomethyltransferase GcvT [Bacteroidota bacterium]|nr:glycine cleavage system aminomethyltransferase GcvT [Bacteroidota bacterium]
MKRTPFYHLHEQAGAKIVPFAGFDMPVQYAGIMEEHKRVRDTVGVFDVSHMGEFFVTGRDACAFLQSVTVNDVSKLTPGAAQYSAMCYENAGMVDDLLVYMLGEGSYMLVVNASNIEKDFNWLASHTPEGVTLVNKSDDFALLAVQGPDAEATLQPLTAVDLGTIAYYHFAQGELDGVPMIISRTGYTGEKGFELYFAPEHAEKIWNDVFKSGAKYSIAPIGLGARDTLRLEMGFCLYGNDIDAGTHPLEAGLGWITKLNKGEFIGRKIMTEAKAAGLPRKLVGLMLEGKVVPRHGYPIEHNGTQTGVVTSGTFSPSLGYGIAMGYVALALAEPGTVVQVDIRGRKTDARVTSIPFLKR